MWPHVTDNLLPGDTKPKWPLWPYVTKCDHLWPGVDKSAKIRGWPKKVTYDQIWSIWTHVTLVTTCDHLWPGDTKSAESCGRPKKVTHPNQIWSVRTRVVIMTICDHQLPNPVTPVTHSKYSSYPFQILQLLQLPISVTPVTVSSYSSYPIQLLQLSILVTPVTHSSYPHQLLQLPIRHSSYPFQLLQIPTPVTPVIQVTPVAPVTQFSPPPFPTAGTFRSGPCWQPSDSSLSFVSTKWEIECHISVFLDIWFHPNKCPSVARHMSFIERGDGTWDMWVIRPSGK